MNLARTPLSSNLANEVLFINFNQDYTCISVGTKYGYKMYNCEPFGKCYGKYDGGTTNVEMLFCTSLVALVGAGEQPAFSPRRLQIANTKRGSMICELNYTKTILSVKLNRKRLIVLLEDKVHVYDITNMKLLQTLDAPLNPKGIVAFSPNSDNNYLAYPASSQVGDVLIFDALNLQAVNILQAHKNKLATISFNFTGTMLATSSEKGTVIRVFSVPSAMKLFQFRRGTYPATIFSITFNIQSTLLVVSGDTETVHIFKLATKSSENGVRGGDTHNGIIGNNMMGNTVNGSSLEDSNGGMGTGRRKSLSGLSAFLPDVINEMWEPQRNFAHLKLPNVGVQNICALSSTSPQVLVVTADGFFYQYRINAAGGECDLVKQYSILDPPDQHIDTVGDNVKIAQTDGEVSTPPLLQE